MRLMTCTLPALILVSSSFAVDVVSEAPPSNPQRAREKTERRFKAIDTNNDGSISMEEAMAHLQRHDRSRGGRDRKRSDRQGKDGLGRAEWMAKHPRMREQLLKHHRNLKDHPQAQEMLAKRMQWAREHPEAAKYLMNHNDAAKFAKSHPEAAKFFARHPNAAKFAKNHPDAARFTKNHPDAARFAKQHPGAAKATGHRPNAIKDPKNLPARTSRFDNHVSRRKDGVDARGGGRLEIKPARRQADTEGRSGRRN